MARWDRPSATQAPDWFWAAVETPASEHRVEVEEVDVAYRTWGEPGKPGLLFIHGMNAHSRWWDFIAPQFLDDYCVAAMDLTGMGDSDYRYAYSPETFAAEIVGVLDDVGFDSSAKVVAHSFGGYMAVKAASLHPTRTAALVLVDSGIRHPDDPPPDRPSMGGRAKLYPDKETALARFRLQPPQPCANTYLVEYIARHSLMAADGGWAWKFDEDLPGSMQNFERLADDYRNLTVKLGVIYGADSELFSARTLEYMRELVPQQFPAVALADAQHHLFLDQPEAFVVALKAMLADLSA
ncbi:MAG: alpha/beta hydrolase [Gammaproteobacteria bacterium]|nr:alpha/beta hydrolase [Gammaproteobacteria bacterium]